jgi:hypothetical protein
MKWRRMIQLQGSIRSFHYGEILPLGDPCLKWMQTWLWSRLIRRKVIAASAAAGLEYSISWSSLHDIAECSSWTIVRHLPYVLQMGKLSALVVTSVASDNILHHGSTMVLQIMSLLVLVSSRPLCACIEFLINLGSFQTRSESLTTHECSKRSKRPDWLWYLHAAADGSVRIPDPWTTSRFKRRFLWIIITHFLGWADHQFQRISSSDTWWLSAQVNNLSLGASRVQEPGR